MAPKTPASSTTSAPRQVPDLAVAEPVPDAERIRRLEDELLRAQETVLHLRDELIGAEVSLGQVRGELAMSLEEQAAYEAAAKHLQAVLASRSWRLGRALAAPLQRIRGTSGS